LPGKVWLLSVFDFKSKNLSTFSFSFIIKHFRHFPASTLGHYWYEAFWHNVLLTSAQDPKQAIFHREMLSSSSNTPIAPSNAFNLKNAA